MREHKYKAWDISNSEWYMNGDVFDLGFSGNYGDFYFDNDNPMNMRDVSLEWVQYTGLKDKNGKEIYEGDIVKIPNDYDIYGMNAGEVYQVYFYAGGFRTKPKYNPESRGSWVEDGDDFEVIGNIYENKELLDE